MSQPTLEAVELAVRLCEVMPKPAAIQRLGGERERRRSIRLERSVRAGSMLPGSMVAYGDIGLCNAEKARAVGNGCEFLKSSRDNTCAFRP